MSYELTKKDMEYLAGVEPRLVKVILKAASLTTQQFCLTEPAIRTAEQQNKKFKAGFSTLDGYVKKSNHQPHADGFGHAVDLVPYVPGAGAVWDATWARHYPVAVAMAQSALAMSVSIVWGGNWYEMMDQYPATLAGVKAAVERYKAKHPGPDFIDAPHFQVK
jgi:peptidoglycan LD-endopeptidase CwlK